MTTATAMLKALLGIDTTAYKAGLKSAEQTTRSFGSMLSTVGKTLGAAFSVGAIIGAGKALVTWASGVSQAAQNVGILTSEMLALNKVAIQNDLEVSDMQRLVAKLSNELYNAAGGSAESAKKFQDIGLAVGDLIGKDPVELLKEVATAAISTRAPLETISEIFGDRLGPNAVSALKQISEQGLPSVDEALGNMMDSVENLGDKGNVMWENVKTGAVIAGNSLIDGIDTYGRAVGRAGYKILHGDLTNPLSEYGGIAKEKSKTRQDEQNQRIDEREKAKAERQALLAKKLEETQDAAEVKAYEEQMDKEEKSKKKQSEERGKWYEIERQKSKVSDDAKEAIANLTERHNERLSSISGKGINADSMAQMGGFTGPQRAGLGIVDRQTKLAEENLNFQKEHKKILDQMNEKLAEIRDKSGSGGGV